MRVLDWYTRESKKKDGLEFDLIDEYLKAETASEKEQVLVKYGFEKNQAGELDKVIRMQNFSVDCMEMPKIIFGAFLEKANFSEEERKVIIGNQLSGNVLGFYVSCKANLKPTKEELKEKIETFLSGDWNSLASYDFRIATTIVNICCDKYQDTLLESRRRFLLFEELGPIEDEWIKVVAGDIASTVASLLLQSSEREGS
jgi:hypothetical protein